MGPDSCFYIALLDLDDKLNSGIFGWFALWGPSLVIERKCIMCREPSIVIVMRWAALASVVAVLAGCAETPTRPPVAAEAGRAPSVVGDGGQTQAVPESPGTDVKPRSAAVRGAVPMAVPLAPTVTGVSLESDGIVFRIEDPGSALGGLLGSRFALSGKGRMNTLPESDEPGKTPAALQRWVQDVPGLSWPLPAPSGRLVLPNRTGAWAQRRGLTLGDVAGQVQAAMTAAGYLERSYFPVPEGFALVTRVEQIEADGAPKAASVRWNVESPGAGDSFFTKVLKGMTGAPSGLYRMFIFVVTTDEHSPTGNEPSYGDAKGWFVRGAAGLTDAQAVRRVTARHRMSVLVYEFKTYGSRNVKALLPGKLACETHLEKAGLWSGLSRLAGDIPTHPPIAMNRDLEVPN